MPNCLKRLALWLAARGHDALHTLDLAGGNRTSDAAITEFAGRQDPQKAVGAIEIAPTYW